MNFQNLPSHVRSTSTEEVDVGTLCNSMHKDNDTCNVVLWLVHCHSPVSVANNEPANFLSRAKRDLVAVQQANASGTATSNKQAHKSLLSKCNGHSMKVKRSANCPCGQTNCFNDGYKVERVGQDSGGAGACLTAKNTMVQSQPRLALSFL